ncbi:MAG TPA: VWA domain-containing protein [Vicinamibacterales bacterium]|nr:VWA domain-containing protein [Vicinamibacterales bacterium]
MKLLAGALLGAGCMVAAAGAAQAPTLQITSPEANSVVSSQLRLEAVIDPPIDVQGVSFFVNGRLICTASRTPYGCMWNPGDVVRGHHVRVVATLADGRRLVDNVRTKDLGYAERVRSDAVLVPVMVTRAGQFVRGLKQQDFEVLEDGISQPIASFVSEDAPLDLILAIDISGSMEDALGDVKLAVKQLLTKLRPGDAATLIGFNDTTFIVAEREKDAAVREKAVDLLTSWGGTSLYDATIRTLDLVSREWGRKGVVIFSDGDDRHSLTTREKALARVQSSDAMIYTIGFATGASVPQLRSRLETYARATGGRAFFPRRTQELDVVFEDIVTELANQYVLSYSSTNLKQDGAWRDIKVRVRTGQYDVRARQGYRARGSQRAGR